MRGVWFAAAALITGAVSSSGAVAAPELIVNGSFEQPPTGLFDFYGNGQVPGWASALGVIELDYTPSLGSPAYDGNQSAEINSYNLDTITQTVTGLTVGSDYQLSWAYGTRSGSGPQQLNVFFAGVLVTTDLSVDDGAPVIWTPNAFVVRAAGTEAELAFSAVDTSARGGNPGSGNQLDAVSLVEVPEPASVALVGIGAAAIAAARRRRKGRPVQCCDQAELHLTGGSWDATLA